MAWRDLRVLGAACTVAVLVGSASAQSFNVDLAADARWEIPTLLEPSDEFGAAAGQPGRWNVLMTGVDGPQPLDGLKGEATGAWAMIDGPDYAARLYDPELQGDTALLLSDCLSGFGDVVGGVTIRGLADGDYRVVVYGFAAGMPEQLTLIMVGDQSGVTGGAWPGDFENGVTHADLVVTVTDGTMFVAAVGGIWGQSGYLNGFQLTYLDACSVDFNADGFLDNGDIGAFVAAFLGGSPRADLNHDGVLDNGDIGAFVAEFLRGCDGV